MQVLGVTGDDAKSLGWGIGAAVLAAVLVIGAYLIYTRLHPATGVPSTTLTEEQKSEALQSLSAPGASAPAARPASKEEQKTLNGLSAPASGGSASSGAGANASAGGMSAEQQQRVLESLQAH